MSIRYEECLNNVWAMNARLGASTDERSRDWVNSESSAPSPIGSCTYCGGSDYLSHDECAAKSKDFKVIGKIRREQGMAGSLNASWETFTRGLRALHLRDVRYGVNSRYAR